MNKAQREELALEYGLQTLLRRIGAGEEFPDACSRAATTHGCNYDKLRDAYDEHCKDK